MQPLNTQNDSVQMQQPPTKQNDLVQMQKQQKERMSNWSEEDEALCKAWLCVSKNAITFTDQSINMLRDNILREFKNWVVRRIELARVYQTDSA